MKKVFFVLAVLVFPSMAFAQASPGEKFGWTMPLPVQQAQGYRYDVEMDGALVATPLVHACEASQLWVECSAPIPAVTPGAHVARVRAVDASGAKPIVGEWSAPLSFTMRAVPATPGTLKIIPGN